MLLESNNNLDNFDDQFDVALREEENENGI